MEPFEKGSTPPALFSGFLFSVDPAAEIIRVSITAPLKEVDERTADVILFAEENGTFRAVLTDYTLTTVLPTLSVELKPAK